ncbi:MAG: hypothetical protein PSV36_06735, partial [Algoriphagus sp.]|nr:hypothetical protein [Algoriphagus sp.]
MKLSFKNKGWFGVLFCLGISGQAMAQETLNLDFKQAVDIALSKNLTYKIQENNMLILEKEKQVSMASHLPNANLTTSFLRQTGQQFQQVEGEIVVTNVTNEIVSSGLSMNMPV